MGIAQKNSVLIPPPAALHRITRSSTTGHPYCVQLTKCRTDRFANSFIPSTSKLWNSLQVLFSATPQQKVMSAPVCESSPGNITFLVVPGDGPARKYVVEKNILASASPVFEAIIRQLPPDKTDHVITVKEFSPKAFKVMLRHVFEKPYFLGDWELALEVHSVAERYKIHSLQLVCEEFFIESEITSSNALEVYKAATKYGVQLVISQCEEVFNKDSADIMLKPNFMCADKDIVKQVIHHKAQLHRLDMLALINWGRQECHRRGLTSSASNVEKCLFSVCGTLLSVRVSHYIQKLSNVRRTFGKNNVEIVEQHSVQQSRYASILLKDSVSGTIMSSFNIDIICELKILVNSGVLEFTGIELRLKSSAGETELEIFYTTENLSEGISSSDTKVNGTVNERREISFTEVLIVKSGQCANITVRIEDLQMSNCLQNSERQQTFVDETKGVNFTLTFSSNQTTSPSHEGPFFIEKLFYRAPESIASRVNRQD